MKKRKKIPILMLIVLTILPIETAKTTSKAVRFTDVSQGSWYYTRVLKIANMGLVKGYEDNTFKPEQNMTVREFLIIFSRYLKTQQIPNAYRISNEVPLELTRADWGYAESQDVFRRLYKSKLDNFETRNLNRQITREEVVYLIANALHYENEPMVNNLKDISNSKYQAEIQIMQNKGVVQGYEDMTFRPRVNIKRAEIVTIIDNLLLRIK